MKSNRISRGGPATKTTTRGPCASRLSRTAPRRRLPKPPPRPNRPGRAGPDPIIDCTPAGAATNRGPRFSLARYHATLSGCLVYVRSFSSLRPRINLRTLLAYPLSANWGSTLGFRIPDYARAWRPRQSRAGHDRLDQGDGRRHAGLPGIVG